MKVLVLQIFLLLIVSEGANIKKCCKKGESIGRTQQCVEDPDRNPNDWIPLDSFIVSSPKSSIQRIARNKIKSAVDEIYKNFSVGFPDCDPAWRNLAIAWREAEDSNQNQFFMIYDDKNVSLSLTRESILHNNETLTFKKVFPPDTYCIDNGPADSYVAVICPCSIITCIRKCCNQDMIFDVDELRCVSINDLNMTDAEVDNYKNWRPKFEPSIDIRFSFDLPANDVEYFLLESKIPTCHGDQILFLEKAKTLDAFIFDANGSVRITDNNVTLPPGEFCGDYGVAGSNYSGSEETLLRCASNKLVKKHQDTWRRVKVFAPLLFIVTILLTCSAIAIGTVGELDEWRGSRPTLAHVSCLAVAYFSLFLLYVGSFVDSLCIVADVQWDSHPAMNLLLYILVKVVLVSGAKLNKCCGSMQALNETLQCAPWANATLWNTTNYNIGNIPCYDKTLQLIVEPEYNTTSGKLIDEGYEYSENSYCIDDYVDEDGPQRFAFLCPCFERLCIRKCCKRHQDLRIDSSSKGQMIDCENSISEKQWMLEDFFKIGNTSVVEVMDMVPNCGEKQLVPCYSGMQIRKDLSLYSEADGDVPVGMYCSDYALVDDERKPVFLVCADYKVNIKYYLLALPLSLGVIFLILTCVIHLILPEFKGLPSLNLIMHCIGVMFGTLMVLFQLFIPVEKSLLCQIVAFAVQFSFLAAFFWLNVMCVDIAWTFSGIRAPKGSQKDRDRRKFISYSIFAWSGASIITLTAIIAEVSPSVPEDSVWKPNLGENRCWFLNTGTILLYFYGPMGLLIFSNIVLFIYTLWRIYKLKKGGGALRQSDSARHGGRDNTKNTQRFILYGKLFSLMGVTWIMEIVSWAIGGSPKVWYLTDLLNALRGVFIFYIFCCKPKVWAALKRKFWWLQKFNICCKEPPGDTAEQMTSSTNQDGPTKGEVLEMPKKNKLDA